MRSTLAHLHARFRGNALVELLVIVAVVSVIATLIVPRYTSASSQAREETLLRELQIARSQLEHYRQVEGREPTSVAVGCTWDDLLEARYLVRPPQNPLRGNGTSLLAGPSVAPGEPIEGVAAWYYDRERRTILALDEEGRILDW